MATTSRELLVFDPAQKLLVVEASLRTAEEAYYRASIGATPNALPGVPYEERDTERLWENVQRLQAEYKSVKAEVEKANG